MIDSGAFAETAVEKINIPSSVISLGHYAFDGITLKEVVIDTELYESYLFDELDIVSKMYVLKSLVNKYGDVWDVAEATERDFTKSEVELNGKEYILYQGNDLSYEILDADAKTVSVRSPFWTASGELVLPSTVEIDGETYTVTTIASNGFDYAPITSIVIPSTITSINSYAFESCYTLKTVTINNAQIYSNLSYSSGCGYLIKI